MQEKSLSIPLEALQGVAFALHIGDDDVPVLCFLLFPDQDQVPVVDAGTGHAVAPGMEQEKVAPAHQAYRQVHDLLDGFLLQGEVAAGDAPDDPDRRRFPADFVGLLRHHDMAVIVDDPAVCHGVQHPLHGGQRDAGAGGDLASGGGPAVVPVEVVHEGDDPVHVVRVPMLHGFLPSSGSL